jgi:dipeptidyl aminopeptidase/acylaminoacyl peptidase
MLSIRSFGPGGPRGVRRCGLALIATLLSLLAFVGEALATFPGRNGDVFLAQWASGRDWFSTGMTRVSPVSGKLVNGVSVCTYGPIYGANPSLDPYCYKSGPAALSPDGRTAAVIGKGLQLCPDANWGCTTEALRLVPLEGHQTQTLLPFTKPVGLNLANAEGYERVRWSADGRQLLIDRPLGPDGGHGVFVAPLDDINQLSLVAEGSEADWSSDGRIVLVRRSNLYVGGLGGIFRRLTYRGGTEPSWSPRGRWIAFVRKGHLYKIPGTGGKPRRIIRRAGHSPTWSPDGKQLAFLRTRHDPDYEVGLVSMYAVRLTTGRTRRIGVDPTTDPQTGSYDADRVYGPDWQALPR